VRFKVCSVVLLDGQTVDLFYKRTRNYDHRMKVRLRDNMAKFPTKRRWFPVIADSIGRLNCGPVSFKRIYY
jgi:hypothetical protein